MRLIFLGLSITSAWGNGHATTYRALLQALGRRGHDVLFLERDVPWYARFRDQIDYPGVRVDLYSGIQDLDTWRGEISRADVVTVGSFVPDGVAVCDYVFRNASGLKLFYDIDTPVTLDRLRSSRSDYVAAGQIPGFDAYLSFSGGPGMRELKSLWGARQVHPFYCSVDLQSYRPDAHPPQWDLGYLGTYSDDRQAALEERLLIPAGRWREGRFVVAGPQYPETIVWPRNVERIDHLPPSSHRAFYNRQRFTLNVTRAPMVEAGFSPSVRLFEAAACGVPIITDRWAGLEDFFSPGSEIFVADSADDVMALLTRTSAEQASAVAMQARARIAREHSADVRAREFEQLAFNLRVEGAPLAAGFSCATRS